MKNEGNRRRYKKWYYSHLDKKREVDKLYREKHKEQTRERIKRWEKTEKGKEYRRKKHERWASTEHGKQCVRNNIKKYSKTDKGLLSSKKKYKIFRQSEKGKKSHALSHAKRKNKKFIPILPDIFPKEISIDWHHVDGKIFVAPIPKRLHQKSTGTSDIKRHLVLANYWIEFYYNINPRSIICEDVPTVKDGSRIKEQ